MKQIVPLFITALLVLGCADKKENKVATSPEKLPNIVWLVAEDQSPDFFPMYDDGTISLPNLESLAGDGVVFTNAYAPVPVCAPTRSGIITGMYPTTLGTHNMRTYSYNPDNQPEIGIPSYSPIVPKGTVMFPQLLRKKGYYTTNNSKEDYNFRKLQSAWDESNTKAHWRNRPEDAPFFSIFNFTVCHESGIWKQGDNELFVNPDSVPVPPYFPDDDVIRHNLAVNYSNLKRMDAQVGEIIAQLKEDGLYENTIVFFYADHGGPFPRHKRALYETGTKVPLIIKFQGNEQKGTQNNDLVNFIDFAPTLLSWAGVEPPKTMQGKALYGAYRDNAKRRNYVFTTSDRFDGVYDRLRAVRSQRYKYIKNFNTDISNALPVVYREQMPMMQKMNEMWNEGKLNKTQSLWFRTPKPAEELYDLQNDPQELNNLAGRPEMQDTLKHLREVLKKWIVTSHDLGEYPEKKLLSKWLPNGEQPRLSHLEMEKKVNGIALYSHRPDATILWRHPKDSLWQMYTEPLPTNSPFVAKAERIGFRDSEVLEYKLN